MTVVEGASVRLTHHFADRLPELGVEFQPNQVPHPELVVQNTELAAELGLDGLDGSEGAALVSGNSVPAGSSPIAMAYSGHQFGSFSPVLGDGRAVLVGEFTSADGLRDLHLKGSGRTPFSRGGDGKATLGPMLREFVMAEAMHALGVSTTRALGVATTGETVYRDGAEPGAVLARVVSSHLRIGTFQYAARTGDRDLLKRLADYAIERHWPALADVEQPYLAFFERVADAQAALVADWMAVGFIHGVMNTDNASIPGETIDYGPCAFMDRYDPNTVYSSIDHAGRYAFGNQPGIAQWNLARFAETLLPLIDDDSDRAVKLATAVLETFPDDYRSQWLTKMRAKLGLPADADSADAERLVDEFLELLDTQDVDYTSACRALGDAVVGDDARLRELFGATDELDPWLTAWTRLLADGGADPADISAAMHRVNPVYVPRNHLVDRALRAATDGDLEPFRELLDVVTSPFDARAEYAEFAQPASQAFDQSFKTFCGT